MILVIEPRSTIGRVAMAEAAIEFGAMARGSYCARYIGLPLLPRCRRAILRSGNSSRYANGVSDVGAVNFCAVSCGAYTTGNVPTYPHLVSCHCLGIVCRPIRPDDVE